MPWPTVAVITTGMDADTDTLPRADILDHTNKFNQLIAMRGVADGVCDLDAGTLIPASRLPGQLATISGLNAQQSTDLRALTTFIGTLLNDADAPTARATLGAEPTLLVDYTVPDVTTSVAFSGLDLLTHKGYRVEVDYGDGAVTTHAVYMYVNGLTANTDYYNQYVHADGATVLAARDNSAVIFAADENNRTKAGIDIYGVDTYLMATSVCARTIGSALTVTTYSWARTPPTDNITSLTFTAGVANGISAGSRFRIYRKDR